MTVRHLTAPLAASLVSAQAALAASPAGSIEEWILPPGLSPLMGPLEVGSSAHSLTIRGVEGSGLRLTGGSFIVRGSEVTLQSFQVALGDAHGLCVESSLSATIRALSVRGEGAAPAAALEILGKNLSGVQIDGLSVEGLSAAELVAVRVDAGELRVTGLSAHNVAATAGKAGVLEAVCLKAQLVDVEVEGVSATLEAVAVSVSAREQIDASGFSVQGVHGAGAVGVRLFSASKDHSGLSAVDVAIEDVVGGAQPATALVLATGGSLRARGITLRQIRGSDATGLLALAGRGAELSVGRVEEVTGQVAAAGVRLLGAPCEEEVVARDFDIERISAPAVLEATPAPEWPAWVEGAAFELANAPRGALSLPPLPAASGGVGLHLSAHVSEFSPLLDQRGPGEGAVEDCSCRTVGGVALQLSSGQRPARVRRTQAHLALFGGWLQSEQLLLAQLTWHRHRRGLSLGPGEVHLYDSLFSGVEDGVPLIWDVDAELAAAQKNYAENAAAPLLELGPYPYRNPGLAAIPPELLLGVLPPEAPVDLRLTVGAVVAKEPAPIPGDGEEDPPPFVGAWEPEEVPGCELWDPQPRPYLASPAPAEAQPWVNYKARDFEGLLAVMQDRAKVAIPTWKERGPADLLTMLFEATAAQMDHLAYRQERAVAEGFLEDAALRRSVEDHARMLDYLPDPGLSATAMVRFQLDPTAFADRLAEALREAGLTALPPGTDALELTNGNAPLEIPAGTVVANATDVEAMIAFATEETLTYFSRLEAVELEETVDPGDTQATLWGRFPELEENRWLILYSGAGDPGHVVRVTEVSRSTDTTWIAWDPRRPAPREFLGRDHPDAAARATLLGNVVPAHHGLPLSPLDPNASAEEAGTESALLFAPWRDLLSTTMNGLERELRLPLHPVSVQAKGYPLPTQERRRVGAPLLRVVVEGDEWSRVDDLSVQKPDDEVFVLRAGPTGGQHLRFGDGVHGAALPPRQTELEISMSIGLGPSGNVGAGTLTRLLQISTDGDRPIPEGGLLQLPLEELRALIRVDNPLPALGGRAPETLDRIRLRAPLAVSTPLSAISPDDYVRLLRQMPEVAGAAARAVQKNLRTIIRVTVLLREVDTLSPEETLRRWTLVRARLEEVRLIGFDVEAVPPTWVPLDLNLEVDAEPHASAGAVHDAVVAAVGGQNGLLDPDIGGLGGDVQLADLYRSVLSVPGVAAARVRRFRKLEIGAPERLSEGVIAIGAHEVATVAGGLKPGSEGLLTVSVCGGLR